MSQRQYEDYEIEQQAKKVPPKIVNRRGEAITLNSRQKNELYRQARDMKEKIKDSLCTKNECWNPSEKNVDKMLRSEFKQAPLVEKYRKTMQAIGADPRDISTERLRRR